MTSFRLPVLVPVLLTASALSAAQPAPEVQVTSPRRGDIHRFIALPGSLRANQQVTLHAKVAGYLRSIAVDRGDSVKAGQVLAELDLPELSAERARHEAEVAVARAEVGRVKAAQAKAPDLVTPQSVDAAAARLAVAEAALRQNAALLAYGRITAPFAGVVTSRHVDPGAFVPAATAGANPAAAAIVSLADYSVVRAVVAVPEAEAARVAVGQPVVLATDALSGRTFRGVVNRHSGSLDERTRTLAVEADLPNADGALRPGMYVNARIGVELHRDALLVPAAALVREKAAGFLFLLAEGKANRVPVKFGFNDGVSVEILEGIAANARVIIPGKATLASGQAVTSVEAK
jgi:membrane fusion protein (multidrug efflux system)